MTEEINPEDYGITREPSEGTLYLMRKSQEPRHKGWGEEVAVKLDEEWVKSPDTGKYMVLWRDAKPISELELKIILGEIEK